MTAEKAKYDFEEIKRTISAIHPNGELFEIRAIDGKWNASGYFRNADKLISELKRFRFRPNACIYITLNAVGEDCYSRKQHDCFVEYASPTTTDNDIKGYEWLMIDLDPKRASGTSSSESELKHALEKAREIFAFLKNRGFSDPITAMSGNGVHLLYKVKLAVNEERTALVHNTLCVLDMLFSDEIVEVDVKTSNPARICKLYGTIAQKGTDTPERPHRMSRILYMPQEIKTNRIELLEKLTDIYGKKPDKNTNNHKPNPPSTFNLDDFIARHNIAVREKKQRNGGEIYVLEHCLFDESHSGKDAAIFRMSDGTICYNCFHNSCRDRHWRDVRLMFEPNAYEGGVSDYVKPNYKQKNFVPIPVPLKTPTPEHPVFLTAKQIKAKKTPQEEFLKTGISRIDKKMRGLKKGFVTCLSGLRGCGKSSIISQITLNLTEKGFRTAIFSGELTDKNLLKWLTLQAAGKLFVLPTQYENYFTYTPQAEEQIATWLGDKVYVYNNDYGNDYEFIEKSLINCIETNKTDLIILDNLMSMNLANLDTDKYARQSRFVERLEIIAKQYNVHIIFVAHPRKSHGFLRLDDVSGSNDIVNRVDNAFVMHRVNADFIRLTKEIFGWSDSHPIYKATNVIEICKDRDGGVQDEFVALYYEPETKRLKNTPNEYITYSWNKQPVKKQTSSEPPF